MKKTSTASEFVIGFVVLAVILAGAGLIAWAAAEGLTFLSKRLNESKPLSNEQIIEKTKQCEEGGLNAKLDIRGFHALPYGVTCYPRNK